jgi:hypothetical protein
VESHKVIRTRTFQLESGGYAVEFVFDDGERAALEAGSKESAELYAREQLGERFPLGVNPLLLNTKKADDLRKKAS